MTRLLVKLVFEEGIESLLFVACNEIGARKRHYCDQSSGAAYLASVVYGQFRVRSERHMQNIRKDYSLTE